MSASGLPFTLEDMSEVPHAKNQLDGRAWIEGGKLLIRLNAHGNQSEEYGPIVSVYLDLGIARLIVYGDINSEEPTESIDLDGALEKKRKETP